MKSNKVYLVIWAALLLPSMINTAEEEIKQTAAEFKADQERLRREPEIAEFNRQTEQELAAQKTEKRELQEALEASVADQEKSKQPAASVAAAVEEKSGIPAVKKSKAVRLGKVGRKIKELDILPDVLLSIVEDYMDAPRGFLDPSIFIQSTRLHFNGPVSSVAISHDNSFIVSGSWGQSPSLRWNFGAKNGTAAIWDAKTGNMKHILRGHSQAVNTAVISNNDRFIVTGSADNTAAIWDVTTGRRRYVLRGHEHPVDSVAISNDDTFIVTGSQDHTAAIWDAATGRRRYVLKGHTAGVASVAISNDGAFIVTGSNDNTAAIWDVATGNRKHVLEGHTRAVKSVAISHDGAFIVTGSYDETAAVWDVATGNRKHVLEGDRNSIHAVAISHDDTFIVTGFDYGAAAIWDVVTGERKHVLKGNSRTESSVVISNDDTFIVIGSDGKTTIWGVATGERKHVLDAGSVTSVAISYDDSYIVTGEVDGRLLIWRPDSREEMLKRAHLFQEAARAMRYFPRALLEKIEREIPKLQSADRTDLPQHAIIYGSIEEAFNKGKQIAIEESMVSPAADLGLGGIPYY
ncbi:MAG TPA: hypothetical protein VGT41_02405 [Candidatus Babeliales bacterium]|nr:hypothetical protein [Candidatus Babeliales bacterium]